MSEWKRFNASDRGTWPPHLEHVLIKLKYEPDIAIAAIDDFFQDALQCGIGWHRGAGWGYWVDKHQSITHWMPLPEPPETEE